MSGDPEALAELLRAARPDAEPFELSPDELSLLLVEVGAGDEDPAIIGAALVAWEQMLA